jgi:hypothetical protein
MPPMFCLYGIFHIYFSAFVCCKLLNIKQPYRSFKNVDVDAYVNDLDKIHLLNESCDNVTDIDIEYDHFEFEVSKVIDKHVPVKHRYSYHIHLFYNFPLKQFFYNSGLTAGQRLFA